MTTKQMTKKQAKKQKLTTTFNLLRNAGACSDGYSKLAKHLGSVEIYGEDKPINLLTILDINGFDDFMWCLRATCQNCDRMSRHLAADFAFWSLHFYEDKYPGDNRPRRAIEQARIADRSAADSAAAQAACSAAWAAARSAAARSAARSADYSAAWAAACSAAWAADSAADSADYSAEAWAAAESAARSAAESAARSAADSEAYSEAYSAAWAAFSDLVRKRLK